MKATLLGNVNGLCNQGPRYFNALMRVQKGDWKGEACRKGIALPTEMIQLRSKLAGSLVACIHD